MNTGNITIIVREVFKENIVRGRGLLCRSIIQAQAASPTFTHVYAALVAVINSKVRSVHQVHPFVATESSTPSSGIDPSLLCIVKWIWNFFLQILSYAAVCIFEFKFILFYW